MGERKERDKPLRKKKRTVPFAEKLSSQADESIDRQMAEEELRRFREELRNLTRYLTIREGRGTNSHRPGDAR